MPALIMDFDGVMIDSEYGIAEFVLDQLRSRSVELGLADIGHLFGSHDNDDQWDEFLDGYFTGAYRVAELKAEFAELIPRRQGQLPLLPGVSELLKVARARGWTIGIATSHRREALESHLNRLLVTDFFDVIVTGSEVHRGKPAPDIYLEAARRLQADPGDCLVVEDSVPGVTAAVAAGMHVVVCPSRVTAHCVFPAGVERVESLPDLDLSGRFDEPTQGRYRK